MATIKEKHSSHREVNKMRYEENKLKAFERRSTLESSFRVYADGKAGIYYHCGNIDDAEGFARAQADPNRARPYPFSPEAGGEKSRDKTEAEVSAKQLMDIAAEWMKYLTDNYPQFTFSADFSFDREYETLSNDLGTNFSTKDAALSASVLFKHKDSRDLSDGHFQFSLRTPDDGTVFRTMADLYLGNYETMAEIPEELIFDIQYYSLTGTLAGELNAEGLALGTSRLAGKIGEKVFSEDFTLEHDTGEKESWFTRFWDGEGCVIPEEKLVLIENGVIKTGYSDKRVADKYGVPHTKTAGHNYTDLTSPGGLNLRIRRSDKTVRELLNGRPAIIPMNATGSQIDQMGNMTMVVNTSLLWDGERVLGRLPEFRVKTNFFDLFGRDFIGVGSDDPIYHDKQILFRMHRIAENED